MSTIVPTITLTLVSHTNVGKTTLARTLLRRDVGEVRDEPHVTQANEAHEMLRTDDGGLLRLWDTPGFGDSVRLLKRLRQSGNPVGWLLSSVWDRFTDRTFWLSQQVVRNIRDDADVVLYLVNATEDPELAAYLAPELELLGWIDKPVLVLLNQLGRPRPADAEAADVAAWHAFVARHPVVRAVLPLDAFARCWVQEDWLLARVADALPAARQPTFARLRAAWIAREEAVFAESMRLLGADLAAAASDRETIGSAGMLGAIRSAASDLIARARGRTQAPGEEEAAVERMTLRRADAARFAMDALIRLHGIDGSHAPILVERVTSHVDADRPVDADRATVLGGAVTGALSGLVADLAAGGLTFGTAAIGGAVIGALGARLAAFGVNRMRESERTALTWNDAFLVAHAGASILRYLAVAHFGRGRGEWQEGEFPAHWRSIVAATVDEHRTDLLNALGGLGGEAAIVDAASAWLAATTRTILAHLYPGAMVGRTAPPSGDPDTTGASTAPVTDADTGHSRNSSPAAPA